MILLQRCFYCRHIHQLIHFCVVLYLLSTLWTEFITHKFHNFLVSLTFIIYFTSHFDKRATLARATMNLILGALSSMVLSSILTISLSLTLDDCDDIHVSISKLWALPLCSFVIIILSHNYCWFCFQIEPSASTGNVTSDEHLTFIPK